MTQAPQPRPLNVTRRRKWPWVLVGLIVVLAVVLTVIDRVAVSVAEDKVATAITESASEYETTADSTEVDIRGFPFLTQAAAGSFGRVDVTMRNVMVRDFALIELTAELSDVEAPRSVLTGREAAHNVIAGRVEAAARLDPQRLGAALNLPDLDVRAGDGRLRASGSLTVRGVATNIDATLRPYVSGDRIAVEILELSGDTRELSPLAREAVESYLTRGVALPDLSLGAKVTDVTVTDGAVILVGTARDVTLVR